jgi:hypothetical protein
MSDQTPTAKLSALLQEIEGDCEKHDYDGGSGGNGDIIDISKDPEVIYRSKHNYE